MYDFDVERIRFLYFIFFCSFLIHAVMQYAMNKNEASYSSRGSELK